MAYYLKEGQSSIFPKVKIHENECVISKIGTNIKRIEKTVKKIQKKNIRQVVLNRKIKENEQFIKELNNYDIATIDGKWLMQYMLKDIIAYLEEKRKISNADEITILVNDLNDEVKQNIKRFANIYKKIRIITNHLEKFRRIEQELYEENGISIIITNNKRKALSKASLIVNFDFEQESINQYNINENAIIINLSDKIRINKKRFSGIIITDYEVEFQNLEEKNELEILNLEDIFIKQKEFLLKEILEEKIYSSLAKQPSYSSFETVEKIIEKCNIKISELYGINGVIN